MENLDESIHLRINGEVRNNISKTITKTKDRYAHEQHFIRCAIQRLIRFEKERNYQEETYHDITNPNEERIAGSNLEADFER